MTFAERAFWERIAEALILTQQSGSQPRSIAEVTNPAIIADFADLMLIEWRKRWKEQSQKCLTPNCPGTITNDTCDTCSIVPAETLEVFAQYLRGFSDISEAEQIARKSRMGEYTAPLGSDTSSPAHHPQGSGTDESSTTTQACSTKEVL